MNVRMLSLIAATSLLLPFAARAQSSRISTCTSEDLYLTTDDEDGAFTGMSHGGTLVVIRNLSLAPCRLSPVAQITLLDKDGKDLGAKGVLPGARFMHPGPVVSPFVLPAGAEATATLRWVTGPVYTKNRCIDFTQLRVVFGAATLTTSAGGSMCGDATIGITFDQARFATDPVYHEATTKDPATR